MRTARVARLRLKRVQFGADFLIINFFAVSWIVDVHKGSVGWAYLPNKINFVLISNYELPQRL